MAMKLKVTQVKSGVGRSAQQNKTLECLGLRGPRKSKVLEDTPAIRGMIRKVSHLVVVEPGDRPGEPPLSTSSIRRSHLDLISGSCAPSVSAPDCRRGRKSPHDDFTA